MDRRHTFKDPLLGQKRLDLVPSDDVALLQRLDGEILAGVFVLRQDHFAEMAAPQNADQSEMVATHRSRGGQSLGLSP